MERLTRMKMYEGWRDQVRDARTKLLDLTGTLQTMLKSQKLVVTSLQS